MTFARIAREPPTPAEMSCASKAKPHRRRSPLMAEVRTKAIASFCSALAPMLSGCFVSEAAEVSALSRRRRRRSAKAAATWRLRARRWQTTTQRQEVFVIKRRAGPRLRLHPTRKAKSMRDLVARRCGDDLFARARRKAEKDEARLRLCGRSASPATRRSSTPRNAATRTRPCSRRSTSTCIGQFECVSSTASSDTVGLFGVVDLGKPVSKLVRE